MKKPFYKRWWFWLIIVFVFALSIPVYVGVGQGIVEVVRGEGTSAAEVVTTKAFIDDEYNNIISSLQDVFRLDETGAVAVYGEFQSIGIYSINSLVFEDRDDDYDMTWADLSSSGLNFYVCVSDGVLYSVSIPGKYDFYHISRGGLLGTVSDYLAQKESSTATAFSSSEKNFATATSITTKQAIATTTIATTTRSTTIKQPKHIVFWGNTGDKVHISPTCHTIKNGVISGSLDECKAAGHTEGWCGACSAGWSDERFFRDGNPYA